MHGLTLDIENVRGSVRSGTSPDGTAWSNRMQAHYGDFPGTMGNDGDAVDVFIGLFPESDQVWVINQRHVGGPDIGFDEHKVMLGCTSEQQARDAYILSFDRGWQGLSSIVPCSIPQLKWWLVHGDKTRPFSADQLPFEGISIMDKVLWDSNAQPVTTTLHKLMYDMRVHDKDAGLMLDAVTMEELMAHPDIEETQVFDALVVQVARMQQKMELLKGVMASAGINISPVEMTISDPVRARGVLQVMVLFLMSDGQTVAVWFHNPDTTPAKLTPMDELISWKWMLNKKDVTIVVAPERGKELNVREVARRIMRLTERNSEAFKKANVKTAERAAQTEAVKVEIVALEGELATLQRKIEVAQQVNADKPVVPVVIAPEVPTPAVGDGSEDAAMAGSGVIPGDLAAMADDGGYQAILASEQLSLKWQDVLDSMFQTRSVGVRNELRNLGWKGAASDPGLIKAGNRQTFDFKHVGAANCVGMTAVLHTLAEPDAAPIEIVDDLRLSSAEFAKFIDANAVPVTDLVPEVVVPAAELAPEPAAEVAVEAAELSPSDIVDAAYKFSSATDTFKEYVADSVEETDYSTFATAKGMDLKAIELGASIAWDVSTAVLDSVGAEEDEDEFDAEAEFDAVPETDDDGNEVGAVLDGDFKNHPFRGNQHKSASHESGAAVGSSMRAKHAERKGDKKAATKAHTSAHYSHKAASVSASGKAKKYHAKMAKFHGGRAGMALDAVLDAAAPISNTEAQKQVTTFARQYGLKVSRTGGVVSLQNDKTEWMEVFDDFKQALEFLVKARNDHTDNGKKWVFDGVLDAAEDMTGEYASGVISKGGSVAGRAYIGGDGKAMVYVGAEGQERVQFFSIFDGRMRNAMWSDDDAGEMVSWLLEPQAAPTPVMSAYDMGVAGFAAGLKASAQDQGFIDAYIKGNKVGESLPSLEAWQKGWTAANLAQTPANEQPGFMAWEAEVLRTIIETLEVSSGDAQGLMEAQQSTVDKAWADGVPASTSALAIISAGVVTDKPAEPVTPPANQFYTGGDLVEYTGKTEVLHGGLFYEFTYLEGAKVGQTGVTQRAPDGSNPGQSGPQASTGIVTPQIVPQATKQEPAVNPQADTDLAYLLTLIDGTADMFAADVFDRLEPMFTTYENDADMVTMLNAAAEAYSQAAVKAAQSALAA